MKPVREELCAYGASALQTPHPQLESSVRVGQVDFSRPFPLQMRTRKLIERLGQKNMYVREKEKRTRNFISLEALTCMCAHALSHFSHVRLFVTPWTVALQAPLSMGFSRQGYWSGWPCPPPRDLPNPGIEPVPLMSPALAGRFFTLVPPGKPS